MTGPAQSDEPLDFERHARGLEIPLEDVLAGVRMLSARTLGKVYAFTDPEVERICELRGWRERADEPAPAIIQQLELRRSLHPLPTAGSALARLADAKSESSRALARDLMLPASMRPPFAKAPRGRTYRQTVVRRKGPQLPPSIWWSRGGYHPWDVRTWVEKGHQSSCPVERFLVCALRRELAEQHARRSGTTVIDGQLYLTKDDSRSWQAVFPLAALAMVLYYESRRTKRPGFCAHVGGIPRGQLARLSAHKSRGSDLVPDTISINLRKLRKVLAGALEYHQPNPEEAHRLDLPHAVHYLEDGRKVFQATNVYWIRDADWCVKNAGTLGFDFASVRVDQNQGYGGLPIYQTLTPILESLSGGGKESALTVPTSSGGLAAASRPPAAKGQAP